MKNVCAFLAGSALALIILIPACALPGAPSGSPKGVPVQAAKDVLLGLAADVENFDANKDGLVAGPELNALGLQAALRLANAAAAAQAPR